MRSRPTVAVVTGALAAALVLPTASATAAPTDLQLSEIRIDQPSGDTDEYAELFGTAGASLGGVTYLVIGDGVGDSGTIEAVVPLDGQALGANGYFLVAEDTFSLATPDLVANLNFENSDNVTHLLVDGFTGANGEDLDTDDDGTLDTTPWTTVIDALGMVESPGSGEAYYGSALGFTDIGPDGSYVPGHVYRDGTGTWQIGDFSDLSADTPTSGAGEPEPEPVCDTPDEDLTLISEVQGSDPDPDEDWQDSPLDGETVTVRAVVTLADEDLDGYFLQEEPGDDDDDPSTSEGIFVHERGSLPVEGATVALTGEVSTHHGLTQLSGDAEVCAPDLVEIAPFELELPMDRQGRENLEGMLVTNAQDLQVSGLFASYAYGELGLALDGPLTHPSSVFAPSDPEAEALLEHNAASFLKVNDRQEAWGSFTDYPWEMFDEDLSAGDTFPAGSVVGALGYSHGEFKVEPLDHEVGGDRIFFPESENTDPIQPVPTAADGNDVVAFNVLNYFNTFGDSDVLRGATNQEDFELQTAKIVDAILAMDAAVYGLVEIENDYEDFHDGDPSTVPALVTLVEALNDAAGPGTFDYVQPDEELLTTEGLGGGGLGTDAITQALIYQPDRATPVGEAATFDIDALLEGDSDNSRWPLAQTFKVDGEFVEVVVNHLKSKSSSCTDTAGPGFGFGDDVGTELTGNCNLTREYAARRLVEWVADGATGFPTDDTLLIGDFNAYEEEGPIEILVEAGYTDLVEQLGDDAFTFKFDGRYGRLDYAFASPSLTAKVTDTEVWQINSRAPYGYLYDNSPKPADEYPLYWASSDHDPVIVSLASDGVHGTHGKGRGAANGRR